jgi:hypothetical protein
LTTYPTTNQPNVLTLVIGRATSPSPRSVPLGWNISLPSLDGGKSKAQGSFIPFRTRTPRLIFPGKVHTTFVTRRSVNNNNTNSRNIPIKHQASGIKHHKID